MTSAEITAAVKSAGSALQSGDAVDALELCASVLVVSPKHPIALTLAGFSCFELSDLNEAERYFTQAIQAAPKNLHAMFGLGKVLEGQRHFQKAANQYRRVIDRQPEHHPARVGYANCCVALGLCGQAIEIYTDVLQITKDRQLYRNMGIAAMEMNDLLLAESHFIALLRATPEDPDAHSQMASCLLKQERFAEGWPFYQRRLEDFFGNHQKILSGLPLWEGGEGKRLLVWSEEGPGDIAMFASVIPQLIAVSQQITLLVEARFHTLLQRSFGNDLRLVQGSEAPELASDEFDARIALASCMQFFRREAAAFAETNTGYLKPDAARVAHFRQSLFTESKNRKLVAINWRSFSEENGEQRSIPEHRGCDTKKGPNGPFFVACVELIRAAVQSPG